MAKKGFQAKRWYWWCLNLLHIETLFFVVIVLFSVYVLVSARTRKGKSKRRKIEDFEKKWRRLAEDAPPSGHTFVSGKQKVPGGKKINKHEERCREIFERIFQTEFESIRPDWLENPVSGSNLELDGFAPGIFTPRGRGLAFEYDGIQHSKYDPDHFHSEKRGGKNAFIYQVKKDAWKTKRCAEEGVVLIRIPHFISWDDLEDHIRDRLKKEGVEARPQSHQGQNRGGNFSSPRTMYD